VAKFELPGYVEDRLLCLATWEQERNDALGREISQLSNVLPSGQIFVLQGIIRPVSMCLRVSFHFTSLRVAFVKQHDIRRLPNRARKSRKSPLPPQEAIAYLFGGRVLG
jgi:hypothetical protein